MALFHKLRAERDTAKGLEVAGRWLGLRENLLADGTFPSLPPTAVAIWDRYLSYAVALGVAATTERSIPLGAESDTEAWSSGRRSLADRAACSYPQRIPPGWGRPPWKIVFAGLLSVGGSAAIAWFLLPVDLSGTSRLLKDATHRTIASPWRSDSASLPSASSSRWSSCAALWMLGLGVADVGRGSSIEGRVLRVRFARRADVRRRRRRQRGTRRGVGVDSWHAKAPMSASASPPTPATCGRSR